MITLPSSIRKNGFIYSRLREGRRSYLYEQRDNEIIVGYEVFSKRTKPERELFGKTLPKGEVFPHNEAFGKWAWSCYSLEKAERIFNELESKK